MINRTDYQDWIHHIREGIKTIADPVQGFINYEFYELYKKYPNFLHAIIVRLYDDNNLKEFLDKSVQESLVTDSVIIHFQQLDKLLKEFFEQVKDLKDFDVIRRQEWDAIIPLAKNCLKGLSAIKK